MSSSTGAVTQKEIEGLENQYMRAIQQNDAETALKLSDEVCIVVSAGGAMPVDRDGMKQMMEKPQYTLNDYKLSEVKFIAASDDVAVLAYKLQQHLTKDGKPLQLDTVNSSTWVRKNGSWVCSSHTETLQGDPWGQNGQKSGKA